ncbi:MAG: hypothetical protein R3B72_50230 [Polyangiaceae bacterium]
MTRSHLLSASLALTGCASLPAPPIPADTVQLEPTLASATPPATTAPRWPAELFAPTPSRSVPAVPLDAPLFSPPLHGGIHNPMPGGILGGYPADTGLDIAGFHRPVYALASGTLEYSEPGHTRWATDDRAVRLRLDEPIAILHHGRQRMITHVWYAHLSVLRFDQPQHSPAKRRVAAGELLGISGVAGGSPHLHLGLLLDGVTDQRWGSYLLDDACRDVLAGHRTVPLRSSTGEIAVAPLKSGQRLPLNPGSRSRSPHAPARAATSPSGTSGRSTAPPSRP